MARKRSCARGTRTAIDRTERAVSPRASEPCSRFDPNVRELRRIEPVPMNGPGFLDVLKEIAPSAHSLNEAIAARRLSGGSDQFPANRLALPARSLLSAADDDVQCRQDCAGISP